MSVVNWALEKIMNFKVYKNGWQRCALIIIVVASDFSAPCYALIRPRPQLLASTAVRPRYDYGPCLELLKRSHVFTRNYYRNYQGMIANKAQKIAELNILMRNLGNQGRAFSNYYKAIQNHYRGAVPRPTRFIRKLRDHHTAITQTLRQLKMVYHGLMQSSARARQDGRQSDFENFLRFLFDAKQTVTHVS